MRSPAGIAPRRSEVPPLAVESLEDRRLLSLLTLSSGPERGPSGVAIAAEVAPSTASPKVALNAITIPPGPGGRPSDGHVTIAVAQAVSGSGAPGVIGPVVPADAGMVSGLGGPGGPGPMLAFGVSGPPDFARLDLEASGGLEAPGLPAPGELPLPTIVALASAPGTAIGASAQGAAVAGNPTGQGSFDRRTPMMPTMFSLVAGNPTGQGSFDGIPGGQGRMVNDTGATSGIPPWEWSSLPRGATSSGVPLGPIRGVGGILRDAGRPEIDLPSDEGAGVDRDLPDPQRADLLSHFLPFDRSMLEDALDRFLDSSAGLGAAKSGGTGPLSVVPALLALAISILACDIALHLRRSRGDERLAEGDAGPFHFPGLPGLGSRSRS
jgi:hypothetical protein